LGAAQACHKATNGILRRPHRADDALERCEQRRVCHCGEVFRCVIGAPLSGVPCFGAARHGGPRRGSYLGPRMLTDGE
jgi:hypothetical protein